MASVILIRAKDEPKLEAEIDKRTAEWDQLSERFHLHADAGQFERVDTYFVDMSHTSSKYAAYCPYETREDSDLVGDTLTDSGNLVEILKAIRVRYRILRFKIDSYYMLSARWRVEDYLLTRPSWKDCRFSIGGKTIFSVEYTREVLLTYLQTGKWNGHRWPSKAHYIDMEGFYDNISASKFPRRLSRKRQHKSS